jgi:hypothetical protein
MVVEFSQVQDLEMEVMIVLGWLARKFHRYRSGLVRPQLTFKVSTFTKNEQAPMQALNIDYEAPHDDCN